eukprot:9502454-Pyramimonas_sp.AAC.1
MSVSSDDWNDTHDDDRPGCAAARAASDDDWNVGAPVSDGQVSVQNDAIVAPAPDQACVAA